MLWWSLLTHVRGFGASDTAPFWSSWCTSMATLWDGGLFLQITSPPKTQKVELTQPVRIWTQNWFYSLSFSTKDKMFASGQNQNTGCWSALLSELSGRVFKLLPGRQVGSGAQFFFKRVKAFLLWCLKSILWRGKKASWSPQGQIFLLNRQFFRDLPISFPRITPWRFMGIQRSVMALLLQEAWQVWEGVPLQQVDDEETDP